MIISCLLTIIALAIGTPGGAHGADSDGTAPLGWGPTIHQLVVVKATGLMPPPMKNQILRHREEILRGCLDVLREQRGSAPEAGEIAELFGAIKRDLNTKVHFSEICYKYGRLSALVVEYSSPLAGADRGSAGLFRDFIRQENANFPLVISREGEGALRRGSLGDYLQYCSERNSRRGALLRTVLSSGGNPREWRNQRSLAYGLASLLYNELVLDSARIWLLLWQEAGGDISLAPYFRLPEAEGGR